MKSYITIVLILLFVGTSVAQKRLKPPKNQTNIESVDHFINSAFNIYNTVYDFQYGEDTTTSNIVEQEPNSQLLQTAHNDDVNNEDAHPDTEEPKDEFEILEQNIINMINQVPDMIEEIEKQSVAKQVRATLNLNKAVKALRQSGKMIKKVIKGE